MVAPAASAATGDSRRRIAPLRLEKTRCFQCLRSTLQRLKPQTRASCDIQQRLRSVRLVEDPKHRVLAFHRRLAADITVKPATAEPRLALGVEAQKLPVVLHDFDHALAGRQAFLQRGRGSMRNGKKRRSKS